MLDILVIQNGYCDTSIMDTINRIDLNYNVTLIRSYDSVNYCTKEYVLRWKKIIILGGHQSARHLDTFPYLKKVIELIKLAVENNVSLLGICLGCQLIGKAYGYKVVRAKKIQVGYHPKIVLTEQGKKDKLFKNFDGLDNVLAFHMDVIFDNNNDGKLKILAHSNNYVYVINIGSAYGVQFHPEVTLKILKKYLDMKGGILFSMNKKAKITEYGKKNEKIILDNGQKIIETWLKI